LYNTIFTPNPTGNPKSHVDTSDWKIAYVQLARIMELQFEEPKPPNFDAFNDENIKFVLIPNSDSPRERYLAWLLCALTPWAKQENPNKGKANAKKPLPMASLVAREGLKVDNKGIEVVTAAATYFGEVTASKDAFLEDLQLNSSGKRKKPALSRETLGMALRRWGPHWRLVTVYAILVEIMGLQKPESKFDRSSVKRGKLTRGFRSSCYDCPVVSMVGQYPGAWPSRCLLFETYC
jgi:hypothetical protein